MSTGIEWTDETWNPIRARNKETGGVGHFCEKVSPACKHCYAEVMQKRYFNNPIHYGAGDRGKVELSLDERTLLAPLKWKRPRMVFPCSMTDLFGEWVPFEWIDRVFAVMALTPQHTYQVLTKRPKRMAQYMNRPAGAMANGTIGWLVGINRSAIDICGRPVFPTQTHGMIPGAGWPLPNVWLGTSVEDQQRADERIPHLLRCPAAVRWLSCEPLLGSICLHHYFDKLHRSGNSGGAEQAAARPALRNDRVGIDWVVCGGESGPGFRALNIDHARILRDQCKAAGVSFFFKQVGGHTPKSGGRLLDGVVHDAMPEVAVEAPYADANAMQR